MIRSLLAFARRQPLAPIRIDLNALVANFQDLVTHTLGEDIEVVCQHASNLWPVIADPAQVESCLLNLAKNARDAMPSGGRLTITTSNQPLDADYAKLNPSVTPGDYVMTAISDTGTGMPSEVVAKAFEPFFTTKDQGKGTGLGLSMVFGFAAQSGGHVSVHSRPGLGTTVRLYLPRAAKAAETGASRSTDPADKLRGSREVVLVVEDNADMRQAVVRQLAALDYRTLEADSASAALRELETEEVDLVFSDIVMPGGCDGFELANHVRARWPAIRILLTSGFADDPAMRPRAGPQPPPKLLGKPYDLNQLADAISEALHMEDTDADQR